MINKHLNWKNVFVSLLLVLVISVLAACGTSNTSEEKDSNNSVSEQSEEGNALTDSTEASFPFTYEDATETEVTIEEKPERIVSVIPSNTEIAFSLGLDDEIVGVSDHDNYPEQTEDKEKIGGLDFSVEKVLSLEPDLVLAESSMLGMSGQGFEQLRDAGINVVVIPTSNSFDDTYETIELISQLTGTTENGQEIIDEMQSKVDEITTKVNELDKSEQPSVFVELDPDLWTAGTGTFTHEMIELLQAKNIADGKENAFQISEEEVIDLNPDVIIVTYGDYVDNPTNEVYQRTQWEDLTAIQEKNVYDVDSDTVSRPGPRLAIGLEEFAKAIYPDAFSN